MKSNKNNIQRFILAMLMTFVVNFAYSQTNIRQSSRGNSSPNIRKDLTTTSPRIRRDLGNEPRSDARSKPTSTPKPKTNRSTPQVKTDTNARDTIYAKETVKQHGWFAPKNVISKEVTQHRQESIRFTNKNDKGKWLKIEVIDAYGQYVPGRIKPYILKNSEDSLANQDWRSKIESACIFEFIPDPTGMNVIQERAYDKDYNIVYTYSRTGIGENDGKQQFIGSYKDSYGFPAEMRPEEGYSYGTLVKITEDRWGNDSIIEYLDSKGVNKLNADLAAKEYFIYDKEGNLLMQQSRDSIGNLIIDNAGNCGIEFTYDNEGNMLTATFMDENWESMHIADTRTADEKAGIQRIEWKYDEYGRQTEMRFVDVNGNPEENVHGCHRTVYEYDDHGNNVRQVSYNIKNLPAAQGFSGTSIYEFRYDDKGRMIEARFLDANQNPCSTPGYLSKIIKKYDENGEEILNEQYSAETGSEEICYKYEKTPRCIYTRWNDGTSRIDSLDLKGRTTFVGFYGKDGKLEMTGGRAYERYTYTDEIGKSTSMVINYDELGKRVDVKGTCRTVTFTDSITWTQTIRRYNSNDVLKETFIQRYSPGFEELIAQDDANSFGIVSRSGGASSVRLYSGGVTRNAKGDFVSRYGTDEFGEPDYITSSSETYYYQKQFPNSPTKFYDENNNVIEDVSKFKDSLPKIMTIEVTDSSAYNIGLRDNDLILIYGDYAVDMDNTVTYLTFKQEWTLRSVIDAQKEKRMVVFRITDPSKNEYGLYEIKGLKGTCSELGFIPHIRYLTDKQMARIKKSISEEVRKPRSFVTLADFKKTNNKGGSNYILLAYTEMYRSDRDKPYAQQVGDPSILLGSCIKDLNYKWTKDDGEDTKPFETMLSSRRSNEEKYPQQDFYVTKDGCSLTRIILDEQAVYTNWSDAYVSDEDYSHIAHLYEDACDSINVILKNNKSIEEKLLYGNWKNQNSDTLQYQPEILISFNKNGTFEGNIINLGYISYNEGIAVYKINKSVKGEWSNGGNWVFLNPNEEYVTLSCLDLLGTDDEDLRQSAVSYMNSICNSNKRALLRKMNYHESRIQGDMYINSINKNTLNVQFSSGYNLTLVKTKEKTTVSAVSRKGKYETGTDNR